MDSGSLFRCTRAPLQCFVDPGQVGAAQKVKVRLAYTRLLNDPVWALLVVMVAVDHGGHEIGVVNHQLTGGLYGLVLKFDLQARNRFDVSRRQRAVDSLEVDPSAFL